METKDRKARKQHKCVLCGCTIEVFEIYKYAVIKPWDHPDNECYGEYKAHLICNEHWPDYGEFCDWIFPIYGDIWGFVESLIGWLHRSGRETPDYMNKRI